jgi:hypothetical protein
MAWTVMASYDDPSRSSLFSFALGSVFKSVFGTCCYYFLNTKAIFHGDVMDIDAPCSTISSLSPVCFKTIEEIRTP